MAKGETNKCQRVEIWLMPSTLKFIEKHIAKSGQSRKHAIESMIEISVAKRKERVKELPLQK